VAELRNVPGYGKIENGELKNISAYIIKDKKLFNVKKWKCEPWFVVFVISAKGVELSPASEGSIFTVKLIA
jgi:hypothetical protein